MREIRPSSLDGGVTLTTPSLPLFSIFCLFHRGQHLVQG